MAHVTSDNLTSNITRKLMRVFLKAFESNRVVTKTINTQLFAGKFTPSSGDTVDIKRPTDYTTIRSSGGNITPTATLLKDEIKTGKATATVQDFFTATVDWDSVEEALDLDQLDQLIAPMARRIVTDLETDLADFMMKNSGLVQGTVGTQVSAWADVAKAGALMSSIGVPSDMPWYYLINPFTQVTLAELQATVVSGSGGAGNLPGGMVQTAWEKAQISRNFGGLSALTANALGSFSTVVGADRSGTVTNTPTIDTEYISSGANETMQMDIGVTAFQSGLVVSAGDVVEIAQLQLLNQSTRQVALDASGTGLPWRGIVQVGVTLTGGTGTIRVSSPPIFEQIGSSTDIRNGQNNTVDIQLAVGQIITLESPSAAASLQPNLFYHPQAFSLASVRLPKLFSTDTTVTTEDGFSLRVSRYADGDANRQKVRFDLLPAYAVLNPWFAGHGWK